MARRVTLRLLHAALVAAAATLALPAFAADPVFPVGSRLGLVPPEGLTPSEAFRGFEDRTNQVAVIMLDMPPQAYGDMAKVMTPEGLKKQGIAVEKRETVSLPGGNKGILFVGRQTGQDGLKLRKFILLGALKDTTALVTAMLPEDARNVYPDDAMRSALVSLTARDAVPLSEQMSLLPFKLDDTAQLRVFRVEPNTIFLTEGPKDSIDTDEQPLLVVSASPGGPSSDAAQARDVFARNLFSGLPGYKDVRVVGTDIIRLEAGQTHQLLAEAKDAKSGADVKLVQWLRFGNGAFVRVLGIARSDAWPQAFPQFRTVRDAIAAR